MTSSSQARMGQRIRALRSQQGLTQQALAESIGLNSRQTLASIEAGQRPIRPDELVKAAESLSVELDELTDPFRLVGEGTFSFRAEGVSDKVLSAFEDRARRWIGTYRTLRERAGIPPRRLGRKLELTERSSFEDAHEAADSVRAEWSLGRVPATVLPAAIERELGVPVLHVEAPRGVSGAAVHLPGLHAILINRRESAGRRSFDLAHELFHLLTWDAMAPKPVEPRDVPPTRGNRIERLADNFAGALLMPPDEVNAAWRERDDTDLHDWLNTTATSMRVTSVALKWRLVVLEHLSRRQAQSLDDSRLANNGGVDRSRPPPPFSHDFVARVHEAIESGHLSLQKAARLLGTPLPALVGLCRVHGLELSYEL